MAELFQSGWGVGLILAVLALEGLALLIWSRRAGNHLAPHDFIYGLLAGAGMMVALQAAVLGLAYHWMVIALLFSFAAHILDTVARLKSGR